MAAAPKNPAAIAQSAKKQGLRDDGHTPPGR
jgi:hypothetical protein